MMLQNKIVLITGAAKGIGRAIAELFANEGARLVLTGRNVEALETLTATLLPHADGHLVYTMDVREIDSIRQVFEALSAQKIYIDCIVNNAGIMKDATLQMVKPELIRDIY